MGFEDRPDYFVDSEQEEHSAPVAGDCIDFGERDGYVDRPQRKPRRRHHPMLILLLAIIAVCSGIVYIRYWVPYVDEATVTGHITDIERRGILFKTYEGRMTALQPHNDSIREFDFVIMDTALVRRLQAVQAGGDRVVLVYERYYGILPWRGNSTNVVTGWHYPPQP